MPVSSLIPSPTPHPYFKIIVNDFKETANSDTASWIEKRIILKKKKYNPMYHFSAERQQ